MMMSMTERPCTAQKTGMDVLHAAEAAMRQLCIAACLSCLMLGGRKHAGLTGC